jgi:cytochrome c553
MRCKSWSLAVVFVAALASVLPVLATSARAADAPVPAPAKPNLAKAKDIVASLCVSCHGADGNSPLAINPVLAGQGADYITRQLQHFKAGIRVNPIMQGMVASLTPEDMTALGIYFSQQKPKGLKAKDPTLATAGQALYRGGNAGSGVPACAACHAPDGAGVPKNYPRLAGQHADYTYAQLKAFKAGERGADKDGKDVNGRIMGAIAQRMTDAEMKAVADMSQGLY